MDPCSFSILDTRFAVAAADPLLAAGVAALTATYARSSGPPLHRFQLDRVGPLPGAADTLVLRGDAEVRYTTEHEGDLLAALEADLYTYALDEAGDGVLLHAAAVSRQGRALVLAGASGAGKSTLALALVARGCDYLTDAWVQITDGPRARGVARPIGLAAIPAGLTSDFEVFAPTAQTATGATIRLHLVHPPASRRWHHNASIAALVFMRVASGEPAALRRLTVDECRVPLGACLVNGGAPRLDTATAWLGDCPMYELVTGDVAAATARLESLW